MKQSEWKRRAPVRMASRIVTALGVMTLVACVGTEDRTDINPAAVRYNISALMPAGVPDRAGWAEDIHSVFTALDIKPTAQNICAALAVTQQESTFQVNPPVPNLPSIARREIESRAARYHVPKLAVRAALNVSSPDGRSYAERLSRVKTEKELSDVFEELIGRVPLGKRLFGGFNPVRTGGPMQVSIAFAEQHAREHGYPWSSDSSVRHEIFSRRGGMYFGIAHLLDYPVSYDRMLYRFADFNAGHYASRNAAFQNAINVVSGTTLALDGDLVIYTDEEGAVSQTERALRRLAGELELDEEQIHSDLQQSNEHAFERTRVYRRLFELADEKQGSELPRATVPQIRLESPKITRKLTTEWFAKRVDQRYRQCLSRGSSG